MFQQPKDFLDESEALYQLLAPLDDADFERKTLFKDWTINDVLSHLHAWNWAADLALADAEAFVTVRDKLLNDMLGGRSMRDCESDWLDGHRGQQLLEQWRSFYTAMSGRFSNAEPKRRVQWAGPDMSVRSSITARLMETWAHGQELYDLLGVERIHTDRIKNIVVLGVNTFGWTFINRGLEPPSDVPHVRLTAPSGETWSFNEPGETNGAGENRIEGKASDFCQVVTQVRNIADTELRVEGESAQAWMAVAQCFAGPQSDPPAPGQRFCNQAS